MGGGGARTKLMTMYAPEIAIIEARVSDIKDKILLIDDEARFSSGFRRGLVRGFLLGFALSSIALSLIIPFLW